MTKGNDLAFPSQQDGKSVSKREYFASMAMQGIVGNASLEFDVESFAHDAVMLADALITELNRGREK